MTKLVPVKEFKWTDDYSWSRYLTCVNHQTALYMTKNPYSRTLHILMYPDDSEPYTECECPFADLRVLCEDDGTPIGLREWEAAVATRGVKTTTCKGGCCYNAVKDECVNPECDCHAGEKAGEDLTIAGNGE